MKSKSNRLHLSLASALVAVAALVSSPQLRAADQTWLGTTDATWTTTTNWSGSAFPLSTDLAVFDSTSTANLTTDLGGNQSVLGLVIGTPTGAVTIGGTTSVLTVGASGIDMSAAGQNLTISSGTLAMGSPQTWNVNTGRTLTVSSAITGSGLTKSGSGTVTLSGVNTYTGVTTVTSGTLSFLNSAATTGGGFNISGSSTVLLSNASDGLGVVNFLGDGKLQNGGNVGNTVTLSGSTAAGANSTLNINTRATISGWAGSGNLTMNVTSVSNRYNLTGDWSNFTGNLYMVGVSTSATVNLWMNNGGFNSLGNAKVNLSSSVPGTNKIILATKFYSNGTVAIGELSGSSDATLTRDTSGGAGVAYVIGGLNTNSTYAGAITDSSLGITKTGTGTLILSGTNLSYGSTTTVSAGKLQIDGNKTGAGAVNVSGSGAVLGGSGTINSGTAGLITVSANSHLAPGSPAVNSGVGTLTTGSLTLSANSILDWEFGSGNDQVTISSGAAITLNSGVKINLYAAGAVTPFSTNGTYTLFNTTGATVNGSPSVFTVQNIVAGKTYGFSSSGSAISLVIGDISYWAVDADSTWTTASNWSANAVPNAVGAEADFGPGVSGTGLRSPGLARWLLMPCRPLEKLSLATPTPSLSRPARLAV